MKEKMLNALNEQVNKELYSAYLYLSMAAYFEQMNLKGFAHWMRKQFQEEQEHAMKIYDFIFERGDRVHLLPIDAPEHDWKSPQTVFENTYQHEKKVTKMIHDLVALSIEEKDYATQTFLQWFVTEQVEEEANASDILQKLKLCTDHPSAILFIDAELTKR